MVKAGERVRLSIVSIAPEDLDRTEIQAPSPEEMDRRLQKTIDWWRRWVSQMQFDGVYRPGVGPPEADILEDEAVQHTK